MNSIKKPITPGNPTHAAALMAARDIESHGFFLKPLLQPGFDVLDIGCGPATITMGIAETIFPARVTAVDICHAQLETARRLTQGREIMNIDFVAASACQLPFADHSFDVVLAHSLLEHLRDPGHAMREFHRVTRPGGFIALCCPEEKNFHPYSPCLGQAIEACFHLPERRGGHRHAASALCDWLMAAEFTPLACDEWFEDIENPAVIAKDFANVLDHAGQFHHAEILRDWAANPKARLTQHWKYATAVRADDCRSRLHRITE